MMTAWLPAGAVFVREAAFHHVGDDLHIAVCVRSEAPAGSHAVIIQHPQRAKSHVFGIVIIRERKRVIRVEPAMVGVAALIRRAEGKHTFMLPAARALMGGLNFARPAIEAIDHDLAWGSWFDGPHRRLRSATCRHRPRCLRRLHLPELVCG